MDLAPRALARWLPWLAAALAMEVLVSLTPPFTGASINLYNCLYALLHVPHAALLLGFAIAIPVVTHGGASRSSCRRLLWGGFLAVGATALAQFLDISFTRVSRHWLWLQGSGNVLLSAAAPGLWGAAIARKKNLQDDRLPRVSRTFGLIALSGLILYFVCDLAMIITEGPKDAWKGTSAMLAVSSLVLLLARGSLLWASLESFRRIPDEAAALARLDLIQGLMFGWLVGSSLAWAFKMVSNLSDRLMLIWHMGVQVTLLLTVTILTALALEQPDAAVQPRPRGPFFPEPPTPADNSPIDVP